MLLTSRMTRMTALAAKLAAGVRLSELLGPFYFFTEPGQHDEPLNVANHNEKHPIHRIEYATLGHFQPKGLMQEHKENAEKAR